MAVAVVVNGDVVVVRRTAALLAAGHASLGFVVPVVRHSFTRGRLMTFAFATRSASRVFARLPIFSLVFSPILLDTGGADLLLAGLHAVQGNQPVRACVLSAV